MTLSDNGFAGRGWAFPVVPDATGALGLTQGLDEAVRNSIWMILSTSPGERVMHPDFGCGVTDFLFSANDAGTAATICGAVRESLSTWEPRIDVLEVRAAPDPQVPEQLTVDISYRIRATNSRWNLVYPFYLER